MSPARAGVDDTRIVKGTETVLKDTRDDVDQEVRIYMGDQNEVMLKIKQDRSGAFHRRWFSDGIKEIILNLDAIGENNTLRLSDNKDRTTLLRVEGKDAKVFDSVQDAIADKATVCLPWTKLKTAWRKAAGIKGRL